MLKRKSVELIYKFKTITIIDHNLLEYIYRMILFSNDYRKHRANRNIYSEEASRVANDGKSGSEKQSSDCMVVV